MVKVVIGNNLKRETVILDENTTLRNALEENGVDYARGVIHMDGGSIRAEDLDKTFADFGVKEKCYLFSVTKADNA